MSKKCRAVVLREFNKPLTVEEVTVASPRAHEVMIKVSACGICHSDLSIENGYVPLPLPFVVGHEAAGVVEQIGENITDLEVGDHVIVTWTQNCGECSYCLIEKPQLCSESEKAYVSQRDGTMTAQDSSGGPIGSLLGVGVMAEYATMSRTNVIKIDRDASLEAAALVGCAVTTGVGAVINTAKVSPGSTVIVFGVGGVGISVIQGAVLAGASMIIAVSGSEFHLEMAKKFGATHLINYNITPSVVEKLLEITNGGADYAFECVGKSSAIQQAYESVHKGGTAVVVGMSKMDEIVSLSAFNLMFSEKILTGSNYGSARPNIDFPKMIQLYQKGRLKLDEMITARYSIENVNQAFADLAAGKNIRGLIVF